MPPLKLLERPEMAVFRRRAPEKDGLLSRIGALEGTFGGDVCRSAVVPEAPLVGLPRNRLGLWEPARDRRNHPVTSAVASRAAELGSKRLEGTGANGYPLPLPSKPSSFASGLDIGRGALLPEQGAKRMERWPSPSLDGLDRAVHAGWRRGDVTAEPSHRGGAQSSFACDSRKTFNEMFADVLHRGHSGPALSEPSGWTSHETTFEKEVDQSPFVNEDIRSEAIHNLHHKILHKQRRDALFRDEGDSRSALRRFYFDALWNDCGKDSRCTYVDVMCRENGNPLVRAERLIDIHGNIGEDLRRDGALHRHYAEAFFKGEMASSGRRWEPLHERYRSESPQRRPIFATHSVLASDVCNASWAPHNHMARVPGEIVGATMRALEINDEDKAMQHHRNDVSTSYWDRPSMH